MVQPRERPVILPSVTQRVRTAHGNVYVTVTFDSVGKPFEVFAALGKAGGCDAAAIEAVTRLISLCLRSGGMASAIADQLKGITCCPQWDAGRQVLSVPDAISWVLRDVSPPQVPVMDGTTITPQPPHESDASKEAVAEDDPPPQPPQPCQKRRTVRAYSAEERAELVTRARGLRASRHTWGQIADLLNHPASTLWELVKKADETDKSEREQAQREVTADDGREAGDGDSDDPESTD